MVDVRIMLVRMRNRRMLMRMAMWFAWGVNGAVFVLMMIIMNVGMRMNDGLM